jgi:predicted GIY-YIG superfamily endonuclease
MAFVYVLRCADASLYVGHTNDLAAREQTHNEGCGSTYTRERRPVRIICAEECETAEGAIKRELQLKRWTARKKEALVAGNLTTLKLFGTKKDHARSRNTFTWQDLNRHRLG